MSNIELNATNIKKFSKRLHKHATEKGLNISLSESQELFAKSLGHTNYHNLCNSIVEKEKIFTKTKEAPIVENITESYNYPDLHNKMNVINQKIVEKLIKENRDITVEEQVEVFYEKFILVLNAKESGIVNCYLEKNKNREHHYNITFTTVYNDQPFINLFSSSRDIYYKGLIDYGMKEEDARSIMNCFNISGFDHVAGEERNYSIKLDQRFNMIEFNNSLWGFLNHKTKVNEKYVFKYIEDRNIDRLILLNGKYYKSIGFEVSPNKSYNFKNLKSLPVQGIYKGKECYKFQRSYFDTDKEIKKEENIDLGFSSIIILRPFDLSPDLSEDEEMLFFIDK